MTVNESGGIQMTTGSRREGWREETDREEGTGGGREREREMLQI